MRFITKVRWIDISIGREDLGRPVDMESRKMCRSASCWLLSDWIRLDCVGTSRKRGEQAWRYANRQPVTSKDPPDRRSCWPSMKKLEEKGNRRKTEKVGGGRERREKGSKVDVQSRNSIPESSSEHAGNTGRLKLAGTGRPESPLSPPAGSKAPQGGYLLFMQITGSLFSAPLTGTVSATEPATRELGRLVAVVSGANHVASLRGSAQYFFGCEGVRGPTATGTQGPRVRPRSDGGACR